MKSLLPNPSTAAAARRVRIGVWVAMAGLAGLDFLTPLGVAGWILLLLPLWWSASLPQQRWPPVFVTAAVSCLLIAMGAWLSPPGGPLWLSLVNRAIGMVVILVVAVLLARLVRDHDEELRLLDELTERRRVEEVLKSNEELLRQIFRTAAAGMCLIDDQMRYAKVNPEFAAIFGYAPDEMLGMDLRAVIPPERHREAEQAYQARLQGDESAKEVEVRTRHGERRIVQSNGSRVLHHGGNRYLLCVVHDITDRKRVEETLRESRERLALALSGADLGVWETDMRTGRNVWDERIPALLRVPPERVDQAQERWLEFIHPDDRLRVEQEVKRALETRSRLETEFRVTRMDGEIRWFSSRSNIVKGSDQQDRAIGVVQDITELKQAEEALVRFNGELEERVAERTRELVASQDRLRALTAELNLAEERERKRLATELHDHLAQLLVLARLKLGQLKQSSELGEKEADLLKQAEDVLSESLRYTRTLLANLSPTVLHEFGLPSALRWLSEQMQRYELSVSIEIAGRDEIELPQDRAVLLFQSVRELLINASKHAQAKQAWVTVEQNNEALRIEVRDKGAGFDVAAVASHSRLSSGFGLFSIRERMVALGGSLVVQSAVGNGTRATLVLPHAGRSGLKSGRTHEEAARQSGADPWTASPTVLVPPGSGRTRVLLVDDHALMRQGLRSMLEAYADVEVVGEACDGEEALNCIGQLLPSIVVMDINMPKMNGIEATARMKAQHPDITIIGLSVNAEDESQEAMKKAGTTILLTKEAAVNQLYAAIQLAGRRPAEARS